MPRKEILDRIQKYVRPFRITKGKGFRLKDFDPGETCGLRLDKGEAAELAVEGKRLRHVADVRRRLGRTVPVTGRRLP